MLKPEATLSLLNLATDQRQLGISSDFSKTEIAISLGIYQTSLNITETVTGDAIY
jgi:hypothetical protein